MSLSEHEADVLVVGSGIGGCMAACSAAEKGLTIAMERIKSVKGLLDEVKVENPHGLMKFFELRNLLDMGEGIAGSARFRKESRIIPMHYRSDYPEKNDPEWYGKRVAVRVENNELKFYKVPTL